MRPSKFQDSDVTKGVINGPRPLPLRINKDSHVIHKPPPNPSSAAGGKSHGQPAAKRQPVIIYTHSPKVIHAHARDFMAIVQKLTGMRRDDDGANKASKLPEEAVKEGDSFSGEKDCGGCGVNNNNVGYVENNETTSVLTDDQRYMGDVKQETAAVPSMYKMSNAFTVDPPLYAPSPSEYFFSTRPGSVFPPPNVAANSISPAFMDYMKAFPDY